MGEAKRRKETDPNYGRVPQSAEFRGLVVSSPMEIEGRKLITKGSNLDPQELRFSLLLWDKLVWPESIFASGENPEEEFLKSAGILIRQSYQISGDLAQGVAKTQLQAYQELDQKDPGKWSIAQGERSFLLIDQLDTQDTGALVELHRAIPIPQKDVPLQEILEFKHRRRNELLHLRYQLESFVAEVEKSPDKESVLKQRFSEIDATCSDLIQVGREWQFPVHLSNLKTGFSLNPLKTLMNAGVAGLAASPLGLTAAAVAASAVATADIGSSIQIKADLAFRPAKIPASPYRYAYHMHQELL